MSVQQNMPVLRHALSGNHRIYYAQILSKVALECQASKNLALKWFQDWKKFQEIQPGKTYAQELMSGKKLNPGWPNSKSRHNKFPTHQVSKNSNFYRDSNPIKNNCKIPLQVNTVRVLDHGSSVAGVPKESDTRV